MPSCKSLSPLGLPEGVSHHLGGVAVRGRAEPRQSAQVRDHGDEQQPVLFDDGHAALDRGAKQVTGAVTRTIIGAPAAVVNAALSTDSSTGTQRHRDDHVLVGARSGCPGLWKWT